MIDADTNPLDLSDPQFLEWLASWLEELQERNVFNACREHGNKAMRELTTKIRRIAEDLGAVADD